MRYFELFIAFMGAMLSILIFYIASIMSQLVNSLAAGLGMWNIKPRNNKTK